MQLFSIEHAYLQENSRKPMMRNVDNQDFVTCKILMDNPTTNPLIYQRPKLQVQPNNKDVLKDQKYNTKDIYLLT